MLFWILAKILTNVTRVFARKYLCYSSMCRDVLYDDIGGFFEVYKAYSNVMKDCSNGHLQTELFWFSFFVCQCLISVVFHSHQTSVTLTQPYAYVSRNSVWFVKETVFWLVLMWIFVKLLNFGRVEQLFRTHRALSDFRVSNLAGFPYFKDNYATCSHKFFAVVFLHLKCPFCCCVFPTK